MIVPELEGELVKTGAMQADIRKLLKLEEKRATLETRVNQLKMAITSIEEQTRAVSDKEKLLKLRATHKTYKNSLESASRLLRDTIHAAFGIEDFIDSRINTKWGSLFREKNEVTKFGSQLEDYACVYTSRVTNFVYYSPSFYFFSPRDYLPHEM